MKKLLIWGAGDQGLVTLNCALATNKYAQIDFLDFKEKGYRGFEGYTLFHEKDEILSEIFKNYDEVIVATGDNDLREKKITILSELHIPQATLIHPTAVVSPFAKISAGCTILATACININATIGVGCIINTAAIVEHDCCVGNFVNMCPKATMAGHVRVGNKSFLGTGCTLIDEIKVGNEVIVGAGAVIIRNVPDHVTVVGVPAKII